jgi:hypothetical protein
MDLKGPTIGSSGGTVVGGWRESNITLVHGEVEDVLVILPEDLRHKRVCASRGPKENAVELQDRKE